MTAVNHTELQHIFIIIIYTLHFFWPWYWQIFTVWNRPRYRTICLYFINDLALFISLEKLTVFDETRFARLSEVLKHVIWRTWGCHILSWSHILLGSAVSTYLAMFIQRVLVATHKRCLRRFLAIKPPLHHYFKQQDNHGFLLQSCCLFFGSCWA